MTRAKILTGGLFAALCLANTLVYVSGLVPTHVHHLQSYFPQLLTMPVSVAFVWGFVWLMIRLLYRRSSPLGPDYVRFFDQFVLAITAWQCALDLYLFVYVPLTGTDLNPSGYNRMLLVIGGLGLIGFGNVVPKLPYQNARSCFEIGMRRYYRLNRVGGWLLVLAGIAMTAFGILLPAQIIDSFFSAIMLLLMAVVVVPVLILWGLDIRAFRRQDGLM